MQRYSDYVCNIYHDHVAVSFTDPDVPGRRVLLLDIRQAVVEAENLSAAIQVAKQRSPFAEAAPTAEIKPPLVSHDEDGKLIQKGPEGKVAAFMAQSASLVESAEPFPLDAGK